MCGKEILIKRGKIYIIRNKINEKVYIGQTICSINDRFKQHCKPSILKKRGSYKIYNAINKYGIENFYIEIIEDNIDKDMLNNKEVYYISLYDSFKNGYNSTAGGDNKNISSIEDVELLIDMFKRKIPYVEIAKHFNVNKATIQRTLHSLGFKIHNIVPKDYLLNNKDIKTNIQMAQELGVSTATITRAFKKFNIPRGKGSTNKLNPQNQKRSVTTIP